MIIYYSSDLFVVPIIAFNPLFSTTSSNFIEVRLFLFIFGFFIIIIVVIILLHSNVRCKNVYFFRLNNFV